MKIKTECNFCHKVCLKYPCFIRTFKVHYCNRTCYIGWLKLNPLSYWKGKKRSSETVQKIRAKLIGKPNIKNSGSLNKNWRGGLTPINKKLRRGAEYVAWRTEVFKRDNYTCVLCGLAGGWNKKLKKRVEIQADHIKPFSLYPKLRLELSNGRTLCRECHKQTPTWGHNARYIRV